MEHEYRAPIFVEDGDPLADDDRLLHGPSLADDLTNEVGHVLMKSSSEQQLARRWGKQEPGTGKSKTSLVITVPPRHITGAPASGTMSGPRFIENGITYQYTSSSSGGNRTASSFGVIGEPFSFRQNETGGHTDSRRQPLFGNQDPRPPNSLRDLVDQSVVFEPAYLQLYQEGETGPGARPRTPGLLTQQEQASLMPKRRRSYSDVGHKRLKICAGGDERVTRGLIATASLFAMDSHEAPAEYIEPEGEVFTREGASFYQARHLEVHPDLDQRHDPLTLTWPKGSLLLMMKGPDIGYLRYAAKNSVCSIKPGANKVLQQHWNSLAAGAKMFMIWSLAAPPDPPQLQDIFFGVSAMAGPVDHRFRSPFPHLQLSGKVPVDWIVFKDVPFSKFEDLTHGQLNVTQSRHANTIPKAAGRATLRRYFEAPHSNKATIHPEFATSGESLSRVSRVLDYDNRAGRHVFRRDRNRQTHLEDSPEHGGRPQWGQKWQHAQTDGPQHLGISALQPQQSLAMMPHWQHRLGENQSPRFPKSLQRQLSQSVIPTAPSRYIPDMNTNPMGRDVVYREPAQHTQDFRYLPHLGGLEHDLFTIDAIPGNRAPAASAQHTANADRDGRFLNPDWTRRSE